MGLSITRLSNVVLNLTSEVKGAITKCDNMTKLALVSNALGITRITNILINNKEKK